jgi:hypothetical protein
MPSKKVSGSIDMTGRVAPFLLTVKEATGLNSTSGLLALLPRRSRGWIASRVGVYMTVCLMALMVAGCKDQNKSPAASNWDRIVEGQNNELYYIDRDAIERVSDKVVRVSVKYAPTKGRFVVSLQELSKEFGSRGQDVEPEYTVSTWEFSCENAEGRCLSLTHFKNGRKMASYKYPDPAWTPLPGAASTKVLRDLVCAEISR